MYWWNVSKLAENFREDPVDEKERFKYYLATVIVWTAFSQLSSHAGSTFKFVELVYAIVMVTGTIVGTIICYRANSSGDNTDFIGRMVCLSWPISIKIFAFFVTVGFVFLFIGGILTGGDISSGSAGDIFFVVAAILVWICYYRMLYKYVRIIASSKS